MNKWIKMTALAAILLLLAVIQSTANLFLLLLSALVLATLLETIPATFAGCICGILTDILLPERGYYALTMTVACFFIAKFFALYLRRNPVSAATVSSVAVLLIVSGYFLLFRLTPDCSELYVRHYLPEIGLTAACAPPLYGLFRWLFR